MCRHVLYPQVLEVLALRIHVQYRQVLYYNNKKNTFQNSNNIGDDFDRARDQIKEKRKQYRPNIRLKQKRFMSKSITEGPDVYSKLNQCSQ